MTQTYTGGLAPLTRPQRPSRFRLALDAGVIASRLLGHSPDVPMPDAAKESAITSCTACGRYVVVDMEESPDAYGSGTLVPCSFRPRHKPWGMA